MVAVPDIYVNFQNANETIKRTNKCGERRVLDTILSTFCAIHEWRMINATKVPPSRVYVPQPDSPIRASSAALTETIKFEIGRTQRPLANHEDRARVFQVIYDAKTSEPQRTD